MPLTLGIDPGLTGALAFVDDDFKIQYLYDMPTFEAVVNKKKKRYVDLPTLGGIIRNHNVKACYVEKVFAMTGQGVTGVFSLGYSYGAVCGAAAGCNIPVTQVLPSVWKRHFSMTSDKDKCRLFAMDVFGDWKASFKRKMDHGRAESALIALYGAMQR